ncbi:transcriptional regulator, TetR family [Kribbella flavida DSM 17836]|uniref:Transcriptional regulator, TetR family n=1 Tax=Kribbella flavida (strain DSM 17836 / JCM 10339 / NBRC 14399) TaxID=479435 RepID=D2PSV4_KRIFD|nr:TetR/AcrR family transcriptional regulator [Kribbella flavida]ADB35006.1 transcriptional regulator, TetR family [Kribbella flavida DSM 17836]
MTVQHSGGGHPDRTLALLWRNQHRPGQAAEQSNQPARGRKPTLQLDAVVDTAIALADERGLTAASMGNVAKALGVGTMTLYTYVPSKEELLDLMVDQVLLERRLPGPGDERPAGWRAQVELYSDETRAMFHRHPWLAGISMVRPPVGPGMLAGREYLLSTMFALGLPPDRANVAALAITTYVDSAAGGEAASEALERSTGQTHDAWWQERYDLWEIYFDVERYPTMTAVWNAEADGRAYGGGTREVTAEAYRFGLTRLLDGIAAGA